MEIDTKCRRKMGGTKTQEQEPTSTAPDYLKSSTRRQAKPLYGPLYTPINLYYNQNPTNRGRIKHTTIRGENKTIKILPWKTQRPRTKLGKKHQQKNYYGIDEAPKKVGIKQPENDHPRPWKRTRRGNKHGTLKSLEKLESALYTHATHVAGITETHLTEGEQTDKHARIQMDRETQASQGRRTCGVGFLIRQDISQLVEVMNNPQQSIAESLWISIKKKKKKWKQWSINSKRCQLIQTNSKIMFIHVPCIVIPACYFVSIFILCIIFISVVNIQ